MATSLKCRLHVLLADKSSWEGADAVANMLQKVQVNSEERDVAIRLLKTGGLLVACISVQPTYANISAMSRNIAGNCFPKSFQFYHHVALNISSDTKLDCFKEIFSYGNMKESHRAKSGKYDGYSNIGIFFWPEITLPKMLYRKMQCYYANSICLTFLNKCTAVNIPKL